MIGAAVKAQAGEAQQSDGWVCLVLSRVLFVNLIVSLAKLVVGWLTGVISMIADGFHSLTDSASNVVGLVGIAVASRPADRDHPYGHHKFETLATLGIGSLLAATALGSCRACGSAYVPEAHPRLPASRSPSWRRR